MDNVARSYRPILFSRNTSSEISQHANSRRVSVLSGLSAIRKLDRKDFFSGTDSPNATINNQFSVAEVKQFLGEVKNAIDNLEISESAKDELRTDIQTAEIQLDSKNPKTSIIMESLRSVRTILERAGGSLIAAGLLQHFPHLFGQ